MRRTRFIATAVAPLFAATVLLAGCSDDGDDSKSDDKSSASESASESASDDPSESESAEESESTDGGEVAGTGNTAVASDSGVQFDLPKGYKVFDPADVESNDKAPELAGKLGMTPEQFEQQLAQLDVWAQNAKGENLNALVPPVPALPSAEELTTQFEAIGFKVSSTDEVSTPVGDGIRVAYELGTAAGVNTAGAGLFVEVDGKIVNISATAANATNAAAVIDLVIATLAPAN